jgi:hypothetical protein
MCIKRKPRGSRSFMRFAYVRAHWHCSDARALEARGPAAHRPHLVFAVVVRDAELAAEKTDGSGATLAAHQNEKQMHDAPCHSVHAGCSCRSLGLHLGGLHLQALAQPCASNSSLAL